MHVSVIIPAFNASATIAKSLHSLQCQTRPDWEAIVVNDGSTDNTEAVVAALAQADNRIKIITQANKGVSAARNTGIAAAHYDWTLFLDSDDWIATEFLEIMLGSLNDSYDAVVCGWARINENGEIIHEKIPLVREDMFPTLASYCPFAIHTCLMKTKLIRDAGGYNETLKTCEDWDLWQRIARGGARFKLVEKILSFYNTRPSSLSKDGKQLMKDALQVLQQAHQNKQSENVYGESEINFCVWTAGLLIGQKQDARQLFSMLKSTEVPGLNPEIIASGLIESLIISASKKVGDLYNIWDEIEDELLNFLRELEQRSKTALLTKRTLVLLERKLLLETSLQEPVSIGTSYAATIELTEAIADFTVQKEKERFYGIVKMEGKDLGIIELPICEGLVSAGVIKDAIASQFAWTILGCFFEHTAYRNAEHPMYVKDENATAITIEEFHNKNGWLLFMQQLWNDPGLTEDQFYNVTNDSKQENKEVFAKEINTVEVSGELPVFKTESETVRVIFKIGGAAVGSVDLPEKNGKVYPQQILVAINTSSGYELCIAAVREGLLGKTLNEKTTLHERLQKSALEHVKQAEEQNLSFSFWPKVLPGKTLLLSRRHGFIGLPASRRAQLPAAAAPAIIEMALSAQEPLKPELPEGKTFDRVFYVPEMLEGAEFQAEKNNDDQNKKAAVNLYDRQHFETLFSKQPDPWKYTHPYEQTKYEFTLSLLPKQGTHKALEIACAEGHFTEQLAPFVDQLTAADISKVALERTAARCNRFTHIDYLQLDVVKDTLQGQYDLIVCSEVLYYVGTLKDLNNVASKIAGALSPEGYFLAAHAHQIVDEHDKPGFDWGLPFGAKKISDVFSGLPQLQLVKEIRTPLYRVQLFQRKKKRLFGWFNGHKLEIKQLAQPTAVPPDVEDTVRWQGGQPYVATLPETVVTHRLPVLMYHRVAPEGLESMRRYRVSPDEFEEQLRYLKDSGYYSVSWQDWANAMANRQPLPGKPVALTFDDGYLDFYKYAWPLLKKYNFTATVFLVANYIGCTNVWDQAYGETIPLMDWQQILELQKEGVYFGAHTFSHAPLTGLSPEAITNEFALCRIKLQEKLGIPVTTIAYPYGDVDEIVANLAGGCGYQLGLTCRSNHARVADKALLLPRIEITGFDSLKDFIVKID